MFQKKKRGNNYFRLGKVRRVISSGQESTGWVLKDECASQGRIVTERGRWEEEDKKKSGMRSWSGY